MPTRESVLGFGNALAQLIHQLHQEQSQKAVQDVMNQNSATGQGGVSNTGTPESQSQFGPTGTDYNYEKMIPALAAMSATNPYAGAALQSAMTVREMNTPKVQFAPQGSMPYVVSKTGGIQYGPQVPQTNQHEPVEIPTGKTRTQNGAFQTEYTRGDPTTGKPVTGAGTYWKSTQQSQSSQQMNLPDFKPELSGTQLLKALPVGDRSLVQGLGEGRILNPSQVTSLRGGNRERIMKLVTRVYPTYNEGWIKATGNLMKDAATGNIGKNARSLNMAIGHLQQFDEAAQNLNNVDITGYNTLANWISHNTGDPRVIALMVPAKALKAELASATKGGASGAAGTESEIADWGRVFDTSLSKAEFAQAVSSTKDVLGSRISALKNQVDNVPEQYRANLAGYDPISPSARQILEGYGFDFNKYEGGGKNPGTNDPLGILK